MNSLDNVGVTPKKTSFFSKIRHISRVFRQPSSQKARDYEKEELDTKAKLEVVVAILHEYVYNVYKQGVVNQLKQNLEEIEIMKAKGATIRARVK